MEDTLAKPNIVPILDKNGDTMIMEEHNGVYYPYIEGFCSIPKVLKSIPSWESRKDDVIVASFPKSGTNWVYYITKMVQTGSADYPRVVPFIEHMTKESYHDLTSPRTTVTHLRFSSLPGDLCQKSGKVIYIARNPKDVVVSSYHFARSVKWYDYNGTFDGYLDLFLNDKTMFGSWFEHVKSWEKAAEENPCILFIKYEDLKKKTRETLQKILCFIGATYEKSTLELIFEKTTIDSMRVHARFADNEFWKKQASDGKNPIFRKGQVGGWKNTFTVKQNEDFDKLYKEKTKNMKSTFKFE